MPASTAHLMIRGRDRAAIAEELIRDSARLAKERAAPRADFLASLPAARPERVAPPEPQGRDRFIPTMCLLVAAIYAGAYLLAWAR